MHHTQIPSEDKNAPNMLNGIVKQGKITFLHSTSSDLDNIRKTDYFKGWNFEDVKQTKELNLTHNLIAPKAGFPLLMAIYDKDPIIGLKNDILKRIKENIERGRPPVSYNEEDSFDSVVDKFELRTVRRAGESVGRLKKDIILESPLNSDLYKQLKNLPFSFVRKIYLDKDRLIDDKKQDESDLNKKGSKRDSLIRHLFKIQILVHLYKNKRYNDFIRKTEILITSIDEKKAIKQIIVDIESMANSTIEEVINFADKKLICKKDDTLLNFISENEYLFNRVKKVKYQEFQNLFYYLEGFTPFSTQHKIKGAEFNNVLVILDNGGWNNKYNFEKLFIGGGSENVLKNSQKIFYVCCTRSKENLVVFYQNAEAGVLQKARNWFGADNVHLV